MRKAIKPEDLIAKVVPGVVIVFIVLYMLVNSLYTIASDSVGVVQRFGKYIETSQPGIHFKVPFGIDRVTEVPVRKVLKEEFGFRTLKAGVDSRYMNVEEITRDRVDNDALMQLLREHGGTSVLDLGQRAIEILEGEYLMLTGDLNVAEIEWIVQYRIKDAVAYLFNIRDPRQAIRDCSQAVMRLLIGNGSIDEAITIGRLENEASAKKMLQDILDEYQTGIHIVTVKLQSSNPPLRVRPAFNNVNEAMQRKDKRINEANEEYNTVVPKARGEAVAVVKRAEGYAVERVNEAKGDVEKFNKVYSAYRKAPEITRRRMYLETMAKLLPQVREIKVIEQKGAEGGLLLNLKVNN